MSILIKGMEMPTNCRDCPLKMNCDDCEGWECVCVPSHHQIGYLDELLSDKRRDDCPLVELPPHGRLIDANEIIIPFFENIDDENLMRKVIKAMPTIIPADGGET